MNKGLFVAAALFATPGLALAQSSGASGGAAAGAATGAVGGALVGGPVGAVVGGVAGAIGGAAVGGVATDREPKFRQYVVEQRRPVIRYDGDGAVGGNLPGTIVYYDVPADYGPSLRYAMVNGHTVVVDRNNRIVQIID